MKRIDDDESKRPHNFAQDIATNDALALYVIPAGHGYSCLGFDVCLDRTAALVTWLRTQDCWECELIQPRLRGTLEAYRCYQAVLAKAGAICREKGIRCPMELTPQLVGLEGRRVEVVDSYGQRRRFIVGKSTGWLPCHLEIARCDSSGGPAVMGAPFQSVRAVA